MNLRLFNEVNSPEDLKKLNVGELKTLCSEIRAFLMESVSKTGGHLASNLGVVELTVALHYVLNSPEDKIIFDVGHQAYVHKILTGRRGMFGTLRQTNGLSGFPDPGESPHDAFRTGHASTAVSAALGFSVARDLTGGSHKVAAVVGDGSMTGGLSYEGLNNAGRANSDLIIILNDNQMSISENVGALSRHLNRIRTAPHYLGAKADVNKLLKKLPVIGRPLHRFIEKIKGMIKFIFLPGVVFEDLGFKYFGPVNGHDVAALIGVMERIKDIKGPVLLHAYTKKGKGYNRAERSPAFYHGVDAFNVETGEPEKTKNFETYSDVFGKTLTELAGKNPLITAVTAAMQDGAGLGGFAKKYPKRFFDAGIAEGHAVTFAAGMAKSGMIPVVAVYSTFLQRAYDNILHDVCLQNLHVVFAVDRAGPAGADGCTHQGLYDVAYLSHIPNMTILAPKNREEFVRMIEFAVDGIKGPSAIRYPRGAVSQTHKNRITPLRYGKSEIISTGRDFVLIAAGAMMSTASEAYGRLIKNGFDPGLINVRFIKPIDMEMVASLAGYRSVYVFEDHSESGGLSSILSAAMHKMNVNVGRYHAFAFPDEFIPHGANADIYKAYGLDADSVVSLIVRNEDGGFAHEAHRRYSQYIQGS